jgi:hypothetical protein
VKLRELEAHLIRAEGHNPELQETINLLKHFWRCIMQEFDDLKNEVTTIKTDISGAVSLLQNLQAKVSDYAAAGAISPADLEALANDLKTAAAPLEAIVNPAPAQGAAPEQQGAPPQGAAQGGAAQQATGSGQAA